MVGTIISLRREQSARRIVCGLVVTWCTPIVASTMLLQAAVAMTLPTNAPPLRQADVIEYLSGGIGKDEAAVMRGLAIHPAVEWRRFKQLVRNLPELPPV